MELTGRSLCKETDLTAEELTYVVDLARQLRHQRRTGTEERRLCGKNIALLFEKSSTRTRSSFEVAAHDQGAAVTVFAPSDAHLGTKESVRDTARVLGRLYDGIQFRGTSQLTVEQLAAHAGVPVWNGLTDSWHPTQSLADVMTIEDHTARPLPEVVLCYLGDTRNNVACSLLVTGALLGLEVRLAGPRTLWPSLEVRELATGLAAGSGARIVLSDEPESAVDGADFLYTDVWLSMGEPKEVWAERIEALLPYQVNADLVERTGNPSVKFMHCLPAMHDLGTDVGLELHSQFGLDALEVTDEVFESARSVVFDQAENRMHTIKALMVATVGGTAG
ncbi:MAG TPA: ornithine carbamoyltransferase [Acidimicrobiales bacterium]|nr:ornithine carbamoyltransferase [Acidimicrobiales bacterium]